MATRWTRLEASASRFEAAPVEGQHVKVGAERLRVFRLLGHRQTARQQQGDGASGGTVGVGAPIFLGREAERAKLQALARAALQGHGHLCVVTAGAGQGKTALILDTIARLKAQGTMRVIVAHGSQVMKATQPLHAARQLLGRWAAPGAAPAEVAARVLADAHVDGDELLRPLRAVLGDTDLPEPVPQPEQEAALATCLSRLARARPLAVVIEDCEHIDNASCAVLQRLFDEHLGTSRLFLLLGVRSSEGVTDERMRGWLGSELTTHVELGPLLPAEAREFVALSAPAGRLPEAVTEHILTMSGGIPLNLQQMTRAFVGSDMLFLGGDGCYELEGAMESLKLPTNLQDSLRMRLAGVEASDPPLHLLLQLMACMGGAAAQHLLPPVWHIVGDEVQGHEVEGALGRGIHLGLLKMLSSSGALKDVGGGERRRSSALNAGSKILFHHLKIYDAVRGAMLEGRSRQLHTACASALEGLVDQATLAVHYESSAQWLKASRLFRLEGVAAMARFDSTQVLAHWLRAWLCVERAGPSTDAQEQECLVVADWAPGNGRRGVQLSVRMSVCSRVPPTNTPRMSVRVPPTLTASLQRLRPRLRRWPLFCPCCHRRMLRASARGCRRSCGRRHGPPCRWASGCSSE